MVMGPITDLHDQHHVLHQALRRLHDVAESRGLRYSCAYGTALGVARHQALIPWDADCDVVVPIGDLGPLVAALSDSPGESPFIVRSPESDPDYDHLFPRLSVEGVDHNVLHVDLFPLVGTFRRPGLALLHLKVAKVLRLAFLFKRSDPADRYGHDARKRWIAGIARKVLAVVPDRLIVRAWHALSRLRPMGEDRPTLSLGGSYGRKEICDLSMYFPAGTGALDHGPVAMPRMTDAYLSRMYGDYSTLPSDDQIEKEKSFFYEVTLPKIQRCQRGACGHVGHRR